MDYNTKCIHFVLVKIKTLRIVYNLLRLVLNIHQFKWRFDMKNNVFTIYFALTFLMMPFISMSQFNGGNGTINNPYIISTIEDLNNIRNYPDAHYLQSNDIMIDESEFDESGKLYNDGLFWEPIGSYDNHFIGTFNGNGFVIKGLKINRADDDYIGLFGIISSTSVLDNIILEQAEVNGKQFVGILAGYNIGGTITNCFAQGKVMGYSYSGLLVGANTEGSIVDCYTDGHVSSCNYTGGLLGFNLLGIIINSVTKGEVDGNNFTGGFVGYNNIGIIKMCISESNVSGYYFTGGFAGFNLNSMLTSCTTISNIEGIENTGIIAGFNSEDLHRIKF